MSMYYRIRAEAAAEYDKDGMKLQPGFSLDLTWG